MRLMGRTAGMIMSAVLIASTALALLGCTGFVGSVKSKVIDRGSDSAISISNVRQIVAKDNKTARTIMWQANGKNKYKLEYRADGIDTKSVEALDVSFTGGDTTYIQYKAELNNLKPATD